MAYAISDECISCGACAAGCPVNAISEGDGKFVIDPDTCTECGACAEVCPVGAPAQHNSFVGKLKGEASVRFAFFASVQKGGLLLCKEARSGNTSSEIAAFGKEGLPLATTYPRWEPLSPQVSVLVSSTHRFNTDTVLLAWFSAPRKGEICADFGTGCGTIPLLWCAKAQTAEGAMPGKVYAVELQADACALALRSVERNQLENTICIINNDINNLQYLHPRAGSTWWPATLPISRRGRASKIRRRAFPLRGMRGPAPLQRSRRPRRVSSAGAGGSAAACARSGLPAQWRRSGAPVWSRNGCALFSSGRTRPPFCSFCRRRAGGTPGCVWSRSSLWRMGKATFPRRCCRFMVRIRRGMYDGNTLCGRHADRQPFGFFPPRGGDAGSRGLHRGGGHARHPEAAEPLRVKKPLVSYFEHNKRDHGEKILARLEAGENCALVSDAGMPAISDPGELLVAQCAERGIPVLVVPGPSAVVSALAISGLPTGRFTFEGFLSVNKKSRRDHLDEVKDERRTMVFYEAPHKLYATLRDMLDAWGTAASQSCGS